MVYHKLQQTLQAWVGELFFFLFHLALREHIVFFHKNFPPNANFTCFLPFVQQNVCVSQGSAPWGKFVTVAEVVLWASRGPPTPSQSYRVEEAFLWALLWCRETSGKEKQARISSILLSYGLVKAECWFLSIRGVYSTWLSHQTTE